MDGALLDLPSMILTARELMARALEPHILMGMPHLTPHGLSETWLMKELGHRHWLMLARDMGMDNADFRTPDGREAYAAICATSLRHADFRQVSANDILTIRSTLTPVSRTQMSSTHRLSVGSLQIGEVELISAFVHRQKEGDNRSIARVEVPGQRLTGYAANALASAAADMRANRQELAKSFSAATHTTFRASLSQEFNGAGLFYFAEFQALMERAFEEFSPVETLRSGISRREIFFFGNVAVNERVTAEIAMRPEADADIAIRSANGDIIAFGRSSRCRVPSEGVRLQCGPGPRDTEPCPA